MPGPLDSLTQKRNAICVITIGILLPQEDSDFVKVCSSFDRNLFSGRVDGIIGEVRVFGDGVDAGKFVVAGDVVGEGVLDNGGEEAREEHWMIHVEDQDGQTAVVDRVGGVFEKRRAKLGLQTIEPYNGGLSPFSYLSCARRVK